jgi:hypothetical protein
MATVTAAYRMTLGRKAVGNRRFLSQSGLPDAGTGDQPRRSPPSSSSGSRGFVRQAPLPVMGADTPFRGGHDGGDAISGGAGRRRRHTPTEETTTMPAETKEPGLRVPEAGMLARET